MVRARHLVAVVLLAVAVVALPALRPAAAAPSELALKRVLLSTGGVGYFEYEARVTGNATLALDVRLDQVDDVLKSIVVFDDVGGVGTIRLPGREPLAQVFRDLPFGPDALSSSAGLLRALQGAEVSVSGSRVLTGRIIAIEAETVALPGDAGTVTRHRASLLTPSGVQQFVLEEQDAVRLTEPALHAQVETALAAVALHRVRDRRTLTIAAPGVGERRVRVGYVVSAPLWKTSYRLSLDKDRGSLQGWAVVENLSGQDWNDVALTLASGNPVTFRQALYTAYFVNRPEVPVEVLGRVLPRADSGAIGLAQPTATAARQKSRMSSGAMADMDLAAESMAMAAPAPEPRSAAPAAIATARDEATTQVVLRIGEPVSLAVGQSMMVPVIDEPVPAETVALYQPATHTRHPLAAVRLTNATGTSLPPGVLTLFEAGVGGVSYVGDARLAPLPRDESRLLSFAVDQSVLVDREDHSARTVVGGKVSRGQLRLSVRQSARTVYRVKSSAAEARRLLIEHARRGGWELVSKQEGVELTQTDYRVPLTLAAGETLETEIVLERTVIERQALIDLDQTRLELYAESGELSQEIRAAFGRLAALRGEVEDRRHEIERLDRVREGVFTDQSRLRDNLANVPRDSDLYKRYLAKMTAQEDALDQIGLAMQAARDALAAAQTALAEAIERLDI